MGDVSGLETLEFRRINDDITVANLQSLDTEIVMSNNSSLANVVINYEAGEVSGTSDVANVTINSTTAGADLDINGVETIAITVVGEDNDLDIDGDDLETVTVAGAGDLNMDVDASVTTVDASLSTGGVRTVFTAAQDVTATGGSGGDTFAFGQDLYNEDDVVDGGNGVDTLNIFAFNTDADETYSSDNIETLRIETDDAAGGAAEVMDLDLFSSDFTTVRVDVGTNVNGNTLTLQDVANSSTILVTNNTAGTDATLTALNVTLSSDAGADDVANITLTANGNDLAVDLTLTTLGVTAVETVNLTLNATSEGSIAIGTITENAIETLNVSGAADAELGSVAGMTIETIDASNATGDIEFNLGAGDHDVTGGSGDDTFTFAGNLTSADTVDGGAGDDTLLATPVAGTAAATLSNVETVQASFSVANATLSGVNWTGVSTVEITAGSTAVDGTVVGLKAEVTTIALGSDDGLATDDFTFTYAQGTSATHTLAIGDTDGTAGAVTQGNITIVRNTGALTVTSDEAANVISDLTANNASALSILTTENLTLDGAGTGTGALSATAALSATITSDGGFLLVDGVQDLRDATSIVIDAADGNITLTGAMTATDAETLTVTATDDFVQTGNFTSDADIDVSLTADGSSASILFDGVLDVDHLRTLTLTAAAGGSVRIDDIEALGVDSELDEIDISIVISSSGEDRTGVESRVTIGNFIVAADTTVDSVVITGDEDGEVVFATGDMAEGVNLVFTEIDASAFEGTLTINTNSAVVAGGVQEDVTITLLTGSGTNSITTEELVSDTITLALEAGTDTINIQDDTTAADVVTNFQAGDDGDVLSLSVAALVGGVLTSANNSLLTSALSIVITNDADGNAVVLGANTNILRLTDTFANIGAVTAVLDFTDVSGENVDDEEGFLVLWSDGASSYLSTVLANADNGAGFEGGANLIELVGVAVTDLTADNFAFV